MSQHVVQSVDTQCAPEWMALHIYYASNPNPILLECIAPLVRDLRDEGLIQQYFFIKYWMEGPHVRFRLLPTRAADAELVRSRACAAIERFLAERPALYELDLSDMDDLHKDMFLFEYTQEQWEELYGPDGTMPVRPNNSYREVPYEPEYDRYGGPKGIELAEWHFEKSSDMVIRLIGTTNVHVRTVMFGVSAQLTLVMAFCFLRKPERVVEFLEHYSEFWATTYPGSSDDPFTEYERYYQDMAVSLQERVRDIYSAVVDGRTQALASFAHDWAEHSRELTQRILQLTRRGELIFVTREDASTRAAVTEPGVTLGILLSGYVHMTNNRLGVSIHDEAYLAYLLRRAVQDFGAPAAS